MRGSKGEGGPALHGSPGAAAQPCPRGALLPAQAQTPSRLKRQSLARAKASRWLSLAVWKGTEGLESCKEQLKRTRSPQWRCGQKLIKV